MKFAIRTLQAAALAFAVVIATPAAWAGQADKASWLFVISGDLVSVSEKELVIDAEPTVIAFTDRPERKVRTIDVATFVDKVWLAESRRLKDDPPNAAIVVGDNEIAIDTLQSVSRNGDTLTFAAAGLEGDQSTLSGKAAIVIDALCPEQDDACPF